MDTREKSVMVSEERNRSVEDMALKKVLQCAWVVAVKWALLCYKVEWHSSLHVGCPQTAMPEK